MLSTVNFMSFCTGDSNDKVQYDRVIRSNYIYRYVIDMNRAGNMGRDQWAGPN